METAFRDLPGIHVVEVRLIASNVGEADLFCDAGVPDRWQLQEVLSRAGGEKHHFKVVSVLEERPS